MLERLREMLDQWRRVDEIERLSDRDLSELGMGREDLIALARMPGDVRDRVLAMAALHGLSADQVMRDRAEYLGFYQTCGNCHERGHCAEVLASGAAGAEDCGFCPNAADYAAKAALVH